MHTYYTKSIAKLLFLVALVFVFMFAITTTVLAAPTYADGQYDLPFQVLKDNSDDISATSDYMVSPAKLSIADGKKHVEVTLNNSTWWQYFKIQSADHSYVDVATVSEDVDSNKRVVRFAIDDLNALLHAKIHIIVTGIPGFEYDNTYDIRFKFDASHVPLAQQADVNEPEALEEASQDASVPTPETPAQSEEPTNPVDSVEPTEGKAPAEDQASVEDEQVAQHNESEQSENAEQSGNTEQSEESDLAAGLEGSDAQTEQSIADESSAFDQRVEAEEANEDEQTKNSSSTSIILYSVGALVVLAIIYTLIRKRKRD